MEKKVGDYVEVDELIVELEWDKGFLPIHSEHAGVITKYFVEEYD